MRLEITCQDRLGITQDVLDILVEHHIDLRGIEIDEVGKIFLNFPNIEFDDFQHLMPKIRRIDGIEDVKTTAFMPGEREKHQLRAILQTLPDPVFSIDRKGFVTQVNHAIEAGLALHSHAIIGREISEFIKGFNFLKWLDGDEVLAQAHKLKFAEQDYLADALPIFIQDSADEGILAGAVVILKSEMRLGQQISAFNRSVSERFESIVAQSVSMKPVLEQAKHLAGVENAALILGEAGSGKVTLAEACHRSSSRAEQPCAVLSTKGLSEQQLAIKLFGNNNAADSPTGLLDDLYGGSLIISDVADMSLTLQAQLLQVIEQQSFYRVGGQVAVPCQIRVIACSQHDLHKKVDNGEFRDDLYWQLIANSLAIPPLRDRRADILPLADKFLQQISIQNGLPRVKIPKVVGEFMVNYAWPGNIAQLRATLQRALTIDSCERISIESLQLPNVTHTVSDFDPEFEGSLDQEMKKYEKKLLQRLYPYYPSTRQLAKKLGLSHTAIANKLRDYGISRSSS